VEAIERYLNSFGQSVVNKSKGILKKKKKVVTGTLLNSISYTLSESKQGFTLKFLMADYGKFIDKGVSGTNKDRYYVDYKGKKRKSPFTYGKTRDGSLTRALDKWIVMRGIAPRDDKGRFISRKSLKFLIARKIYTQGKEGISFFQKPLQLELRGFTTSMGKALKEDIINTIEK
tara:strand:- start:445 stop:966 length:522 start_codon:yes stop_codon:yes gene_type:complete